MQILIADDEQKLRQTLADYMTAKGFDVMTAADGEDAVARCSDHGFDLIILDVMMPNMDGIAACRAIKELTDAPVLFLSALGEERDVITGFRSGCDDYIIKPFPLAVLYEKCLAMIKRYRGFDQEYKIHAGSLSVDLARRKAAVNGNEILLSARDFELLLYLVQNRGVVLSRELILTRIWGYDFEGDTRVVDTHIKIIRKALGSIACCVKTVVGIGYTFEEETA